MNRKQGVRGVRRGHGVYKKRDNKTQRSVHAPLLCLRRHEGFHSAAPTCPSTPGYSRGMLFSLKGEEGSTLQMGLPLWLTLFMQMNRRGAHVNKNRKKYKTNSLWAKVQRNSNLPFSENGQKDTDFWKCHQISCEHAGRSTSDLPCSHCMRRISCWSKGISQHAWDIQPARQGLDGNQALFFFVLQGGLFWNPLARWRWLKVTHSEAIEVTRCDKEGTITAEKHQPRVILWGRHLKKGSASLDVWSVLSLYRCSRVTKGDGRIRVGRGGVVPRNTHALCRGMCHLSGRKLWYKLFLICQSVANKKRKDTSGHWHSCQQESLVLHH